MSQSAPTRRWEQFWNNRFSGVGSPAHSKNSTNLNQVQNNNPPRSSYRVIQIINDENAQLREKKEW